MQGGRREVSAMQGGLLSNILQPSREATSDIPYQRGIQAMDRSLSPPSPSASNYQVLSQGCSVTSVAAQDDVHGGVNGDAGLRIEQEAVGVVAMAAGVFDFDESVRRASRTTFTNTGGLQKRQLVKGLGMPLAIDDDNAVLVVSFPVQPPSMSSMTAISTDTWESSEFDSESRCRCLPQGVLSLEQPEMINNPAEMYCAIFPYDPEDAFENRFGWDETMLATDFHKIVIERFKEVCNKLELRTFDFLSMDKDELFFKVSATPGHKIYQRLAAVYGYMMPFREQAYQDYKTGKPPTDGDGRPTVAYTEFQDWLKEPGHGPATPDSTGEMPERHEISGGLVDDFCRVDEIRLLTSGLSAHINLDRLQEAGAKVFPAAEFERCCIDMHKSWSSLANVVKQPTHAEIEKVRGYFGEEIGLFFSFHASYIRNLSWLAVLGLFTWVFERSFKLLSLDFDVLNHVRCMFGLVIVIWATFFQMSFQHRTQRLKLRWGMTEHDSRQPRVLSDYKEELEGSVQQQVTHIASKVCMLVYCLVYLSTWTFVLSQVKLSTWWEAKLSTAVQFAFSFVWGKVAPILVSKENHRTGVRRNDALIQTIGYVKLFVYLMPSLKIALLRDIFKAQCFGTFDEGVQHIFNSSEGARWPDGVKPEDYQLWAKEYTFDIGVNASWLYNVQHDMGFLNRTLAAGVKKSDTVCFFGCIPQDCQVDEDGGSAYCLTDCFHEARELLDSLYFFHVASTLTSILIPLVKTRWYIRSEIKKMEGRASEESYSFLQFQAKCPKYEYKSLGGSIVEDFMEVTLSFALLACFGILSPFLSVAGFVLQLVEYRLVAYRMVHITQRPYPTGTEGIGSLSGIMEVVLVLAVLCNSALATFRLKTPMRRLPSDLKVIVFLALGYGLAAIRIVMRIVFPQTPRDVARATDMNAEFKSAVSAEKMEVLFPDRRVAKAKATSGSEAKGLFDVFDQSAKKAKVALAGVGGAVEAFDQSAKKAQVALAGVGGAVLNRGDPLDVSRHKPPST